MAETPVTGSAMLRHMNMLLPLLLLVIQAAPAPTANPQFLRVDFEDIRVCPARDTDEQWPDFSSVQCETQSFYEIDPQGTHLWLQTRIELDERHLRSTVPLGLAILGKASSRIWINGHALTPNGRPADSAEDEEPGLMDASLFVPRDILRVGENSVVVRLSSHNGYLHLTHPMHMLAIGPYVSPTRQTLVAYWPAMITFGAFALAFVFFAVSAIRGTDREGQALLAGAALFAGFQLFAETARGTIAYSYPLHDLRLIAITAGINLFALSFLAYLVKRFSGWTARLRWFVNAGAALIALGVIFTAVGYDTKAGYGFLTTCLITLAATLYWGLKGQRLAFAFAGFAAVFAGSLLILQSQFLDLHFFYIAAALLAFLFWQSALELVRERRNRQIEEHRASQLEVALSQARQKSAPDQIQLVSSGRVDYIATDTITQLKGAGDYVEVNFESGQTKLYNGGLTQLESDLPPTFLRVHRSHIVNTAFVSALERDASGIGKLVLSNGSEAPVSRRIMPKVRSALEAS